MAVCGEVALQVSVVFGAFFDNGVISSHPISSVIYSIYNFLPIYKSLPLFIQFYGKGSHFALVGLERLGILLGFHLLRGSINAAIVAQLQLQNIDVIGGFHHHVYHVRGNHLLHFHTATYGY